MPGSHSTHSTDTSNKRANGDNKINKFDTIKKDEYLALLRQGHISGLGASLAGIHRATVSTHMKKDNGLVEAVSEAESYAIGKVEGDLFETVTSGDITVMQVYLYNRDPKRCTGRSSVRLAGEGDKEPERGGS